MRILFVAGGTGGPTMPLIALAQALAKQQPNAKLAFITDHSPLSKDLLSPLRVPLFTVPAGKWRRYFSIQNLWDIGKTLAGFIKSIFLLRRLQPDIVFSAGSYVSVPVGLAARVLRIKLIIHQQDVVPSLSNRILAPFATRITVSVPKQIKDFPESSGVFATNKRAKVICTGNPIREEIAQGSVVLGRKIFETDHKLPTVLILGGGTGALALNEIVTQSLNELTKAFNVIHITGKGKSLVKVKIDRYHPYDFLKQNLAHAFKLSDIVVSRAGFSTISELAACRKPVILVPIPNSHQETNAEFLEKFGAAIFLTEEELTAGVLVRLLRRLLHDSEARNEMSDAISALLPSGATERVLKVIYDVYKTI